MNSIEDNISKRLFSPSKAKGVEEDQLTELIPPTANTEAKPKRARVKRKLPNADDKLLKEIADVVTDYQKKKKRPTSTRTPYGWDYNWTEEKNRKR